MMPASPRSSVPQSGTPTERSLLPVLQRQKPPPVTPRRQKRRFAFKPLAILAVLLLLALGGCITVVPDAPPEASSQRQKTERESEFASHNTDELLIRFAQGDSTEGVLQTPTAVAELPTLQFLSSPTPLSLPESTPTPDPTNTPTRVITNTPTPTFTPSPTPTTSPTSTPLPLPTATSPAANPLAATETPTAIVQPGIEYVVIISIDGLRPDALQLAHTPNLDKLIKKGAYCPKAQTLSLSITLPSHASMLSGMTAEKHGIVWGLPYIGWPGMEGPTLFNVAHDAGFKTGMVFGKEKLNYLILGDSVDKLFGVDAHDTEVKRQAVKFIQSDMPHVLFVHFPDTDRVGHAYGWMSENQFQAITFVDGLIGEIVAALESQNYFDRTLLIVTSDHGGHGFGHGDDSPLDRTIPWLAVGPGVPEGVILGGPINTFDTAATVLHALNLPIPAKWDGKPVLEIFQMPDAQFAQN